MQEPPEIDLADTLKHFGLRPLDQGHGLEGGEDNVIIAVATDHGTVVVRRYELTPPELVDAELELVDFLAAEGYPTPPPLHTVTGARMMDVERPIAVFPFVEGATPDGTDADLAAELGDLLGRLHVLTSDWDDRRLRRIDRIRLLRDGAEREWRLTGGADFKQELLEFLQTRATYLEATLPRLPAGTLHHDLHHLNVLVRDGHVVAVLDFDEVNHGPLAIDPLRTFHYVASEDAEWRLPEAISVGTLAAYTSRRTLSALELEALPALFDMLNLVDAVDFLEDPPGDVTDVAQCRSLQVYRANRDYLFAF